ncbi:unnamed protein product, partial [Effrenium voratum]
EPELCSEAEFECEPGAGGPKIGPLAQYVSSEEDSPVAEPSVEEAPLHASAGLSCLACYHSSDEEEIHPPSVSAFSVAGVSDEGDLNVVRQLISQQLQEDSAAQAMELALMQREDPRYLALEVIRAT